MEKAISKLAILLACLQLSACASSSAYAPLLRAEPALGAKLIRAPRIIRLYFNALPDVAQSSLKLIGPSGEHQLRGMHIMASDDLMIEIIDPVTTGQYTIEWVTVVGEDPSIHAGSFNFSVTVQ